MKRLFLISLLYFSPLLWRGAGGEVHAQRAQIDSLLKLNVSYTNNDNKKLNIINTLAEKYTWVQIDSALNYSNQAIALADKLNNKSELVTAYNNKAVSLNQLTLLDEEEKVLQTALALSKASNNTNGIAETYLNLCQLREGDEKKKLIDDALNLYTKTDNKKGMAKAWFQLGTYLTFQNTDSALKCNQKALDLFTIEKNNAWIGSSMNNIAYLYQIGDSLESSLSYANELLKTSIKQGNITNAISGYSNIGGYYYTKSDWLNAINNYLKALPLAEQMNSVSSQSSLLNNIGGIYQAIENYDKAIYYLSKGKQASIGIPENLIYACMVIGAAFQDQNKFDSARINMEQALAVAIKTNNNVRLPNCYIALAKLSTATKNFSKTFYYLHQFLNCEKKEYVQYYMDDYYYQTALTVKYAPDSVLIKNKISPAHRKDLAIENLLNGYHIIKERHSEYDSKYILKELSDTYAEQGNTAKAYYLFKEYVNITDSVAKTGNTNAITNLQLQYDSEKQEQQIASLTKDKALHQTEIEKQKTTRNAFIGGLVLMLLLAGVTYNRYRMKQKANTEIENTLTHLKKTQEQLVQQGKLAALGKMTAEVAVEIQTPLQKVKQQSVECEKLVEQFSNSKNETEQNQILDKLESILETINQNGKMADGIVKNVLVQSRR